jgi:hypothetical protein
MKMKSTYHQSAVALESAGVDLEIGTHGVNSSTLKVACGPPGIGDFFQGRIEGRITVLTVPPVLLANLLS